MNSSRKLLPWLAVPPVLASAALLLRYEGRSWFCACGRIGLWTGDAWGAENSQQLFDPYTFTHLLHGFALCGLLAFAAPKLSAHWRLLVAVALESLWEVFENSEFVIRRYRETTAALGYTGDTVLNSLGDVLACAAGFLLARKLGPLRTVAAFLLVEAVLLFAIRDSLLLNIVMLVYPSDAIRAWQAGR